MKCMGQTNQWSFRMTGLVPREGKHSGGWQRIMWCEEIRTFTDVDGISSCEMRVLVLHPAVDTNMMMMEGLLRIPKNGHYLSS